MSAKKENRSKKIITLLSFVIIVAFCFLPSPAGLPTAGMQLCGIFIACMLLWNFVSTEWPSYLVMVLLVLFGFMKANAVFSSAMGNSTINMLIPFFMMSYLLSEVGFTKRLAIMCMTSKFARRSPWALVTMILFGAWLLASFMSQTAALLVFIPLVEQIFDKLQYKKKDYFPQMMMLGLGFSCSIGSANTPFGHAVMLIPLQMLQDNFGITVNFVNFSIFGFISGLVIFACMILMFRFIYRPDLERLRAYDLDTFKAELAPMSLREKIAAIGFAFIVIIWVVQSFIADIIPGIGSYISGLGYGIPVMMVIVLLCLIEVDGKPIMDFKASLVKGVPWGAIIYTAAVFVLSSAMSLEKVGLSSFLTEVFTPLVQDMSPTTFILAVAVASVLITNFTSNTVVVTVFFTIATPIAAAMGNVNIAVLGVLIGAAGSYAYATPTSTLPMAVVAGTDWVDVKAMLKYGMIMCIPSILALVFIAYPISNLLF